MSRAPGLRGMGCGKLAEYRGGFARRLAADQRADEPGAGGAASGGAVQEVGRLLAVAGACVWFAWWVLATRCGGDC